LFLLGLERITTVKKNGKHTYRMDAGFFPNAKTGKFMNII
jgi:hypothetical protein